MTPVSYDERISAEAGAWLARLHASDLSASDEQTFRNWLAANPAHAAAFEDATHLWENLGAVSRSAYFPERSKPGLSRRALVAGSVGLALGSGILFPQDSASAQSVRTAVGERRRFLLRDGTELLLDTDTSVLVGPGQDARFMTLRHGRINCRVAPTGPPFAVMAAERLVVGEGSVFDLGFIENCFFMVQIEGTATVKSAAGHIALRAGQRAVGRPTQPLSCDWPPLSSLTAWQTGHLVFQDEPVAAAIKEMNRYSTTKLEVDDPGLASQRISGGYLAGDNAGFAQSLARLFAITIRQTNGSIKLISSTTAI